MRSIKSIAHWGTRKHAVLQKQTVIIVISNGIELELHSSSCQIAYLFIIVKQNERKCVFLKHSSHPIPYRIPNNWYDFRTEFKNKSLRPEHAS